MPTAYIKQLEEELENLRALLQNQLEDSRYPNSGNTRGEIRRVLMTLAIAQQIQYLNNQMDMVTHQLSTLNENVGWLTQQKAR